MSGQRGSGFENRWAVKALQVQILCAPLMLCWQRGIAPTWKAEVCCKAGVVRYHYTASGVVTELAKVPAC